MRAFDRAAACGHGSAVELEPQPPLDLAVVWTDPPRPMLCLEPWTAPRGLKVQSRRKAGAKREAKRA